MRLVVHLEILGNLSIGLQSRFTFILVASPKSSCAQYHHVITLLDAKSLPIKAFYFLRATISWDVTYLSPIEI